MQCAQLGAVGGAPRGDVTGAAADEQDGAVGSAAHLAARRLGRARLLETGDQLRRPRLAHIPDAAFAVAGFGGYAVLGQRAQAVDSALPVACRQGRGDAIGAAPRGELPGHSAGDDGPVAGAHKQRVSRLLM